MPKQTLPNAKNMRKNSRHEVNLTATLSGSTVGNLQVHVHDISTGGARLSNDETKVDKGSCVEIKLPFLSNLDAHVAWSDGREFGVAYECQNNEIEEFLYNLATYGTSHLQ